MHLSISRRIKDISGWYWANQLSDVDISDVNVNSFVGETSPTDSNFFLNECTDECHYLGLSQTHFLADLKSKKLIAYITLSAFRFAIKKKGIRNALLPQTTSPEEENMKDYFSVVKIDRFVAEVSLLKNDTAIYVFQTIIKSIKENVYPNLRTRFILAFIENEKIHKDFLTLLKFDDIPYEWMDKETRKRLREKNHFVMYFDLITKNLENT